MGENAVLEGSIIDPNSRVGANTVLRDSIVAGGVTSLSGSYAIAAVFEGTDTVFGTRSGSPLVLG